jgi:hypothetical protein
MYAEHGIVTFPIRENKRPAISNYQKLGARGSRILAQSRLANLPAAGFMTNQRNASRYWTLIRPMKRFWQTL